MKTAELGRKRLVNFILVFGLVCLMAFESFGQSNLGAFKQSALNARAKGVTIWAGGRFTASGSDTVNRLAKWNGAKWVQPTDGAGPDDTVESLLIWNEKLYIAGAFANLDGSAADLVGVFDGMEYSDIGGSPTYLTTSGSAVPKGQDLVTFNNNLYLLVYEVSKTMEHSLYEWDGSSWSSYGLSIPSSGSELAVAGYVWNSKLYTLGAFNDNSVPANNDFIYWNGAPNYLTTETVSPVGDMVEFNGNLVVGGSFSALGGVSVNNIASYNGSTFSTLGTGLNSAVYAVCVFKDDLYVGGAFTTAGGNTAWGIAKWDGSSWSALAKDGVLGSVNVLKSDDNYLYVGGSFNNLKDGTTNYKNVARYDGSNWSRLGSGFNGIVESLELGDL